jgi:Icc protein
VAKVRWAHVALSAVLALVAAGCLRQAEERALGDLEAGVGTAGGVTFAVEGGRAHIRSIEDGSLSLWALAPVLRISATSEAESATTWNVEVQNCMPGAEMVAVAQPLAITALGGPRPTVQTWQIELPAPGDVALAVAPPDHDVAASFRIGVVSDIQEGLGEVDEVFARINDEAALRMVLSAGDLAQDGTDREYQLLMEQIETLAIPFYTTVGNHDIKRGPGNWRHWFGRFTVHFDFKGAAFSLVDSASATIDPIVYGWLDEWLEDAADRVHVFLTHIPPLDPVGVRSAAFRSRREAGKLLAKLAAGGVDLTIYGHIHSYYEFENAGIPAYISGGGGAYGERWDGIGRHFLAVEIAPDRAPEVTVVRVD